MTGEVTLRGLVLPGESCMLYSNDGRGDAEGTCTAGESCMLYSNDGRGDAAGTCTAG